MKNETGLGYITLNRPDALNAVPSLGDFSEARNQLTQLYARGKNPEKV